MVNFVLSILVWYRYVSVAYCSLKKGLRIIFFLKACPQKIMQLHIIILSKGFSISFILMRIRIQVHMRLHFSPDLQVIKVKKKRKKCSTNLSQMLLEWHNHMSSYFCEIFSVAFQTHPSSEDRSYIR